MKSNIAKKNSKVSRLLGVLGREKTLAKNFKTQKDFATYAFNMCICVSSAFIEVN